MIPCPAHVSCARLLVDRPSSQATPLGTTLHVHHLGKCRLAVTTGKDDLWTARGRFRRRRADPADSSVELTVWWQADQHRRRTSAEERKRHGRTAVPRCHRPATSLLRAVVLSVGRAAAEPTITEKSS